MCLIDLIIMIIEQYDIINIINCCGSMFSLHV